MDCLCIWREDSRLCTLSDLKQLYKEDRLEEASIYRCRITEEDPDDRKFWIHREEIRRYIEMEPTFKKLHDEMLTKLMWGDIF